MKNLYDKWIDFAGKEIIDFQYAEAVLWQALNISKRGITTRELGWKVEIAKEVGK
jgi:hypothetical protein